MFCMHCLLCPCHSLHYITCHSTSHHLKKIQVKNSSWWLRNHHSRSGEQVENCSPLLGSGELKFSTSRGSPVVCAVYNTQTLSQLDLNALAKTRKKLKVRHFHSASSPLPYSESQQNSEVRHFTKSTQKFSTSKNSDFLLNAVHITVPAHATTFLVIPAPFCSP